MNKRIIALILVFLVVVILVSATTFTPAGNIDMKDTYNITNIPSILVGDNQTICFGDAGCGTDSYIKFNGTTLIIKVN